MAEIDPKLSNQLFLSRDQIREQLIGQIQNYLELVDVDLTKSSFITYIIDVLSTLSANMLFYQVSVYKEFFLTKAQLPESVLNLSAFIGYTPLEANYASCNVTMTFPFTFQHPHVEFTIPNNSKFQTGDGIQFVSTYETKIIVDPPAHTVNAFAISENSSTPLIVIIDNTHNTFSLMIPVVQKEVKNFEFQIAQDMPQYRFSEYNVRFEGQLSDISVEVKNPYTDEWRIYTRYNSLYLMKATDYGYVAKPNDSGYTIYFGNDLIGVQPPSGGTIKITISTTLGSRGNIIANSIVSGTKINYLKTDGSIENINYQVYNASPAIGGSNVQSLEEIKSGAIDNLTSLHRFVSEDDYKNALNIHPDIPLLVNSIPILKRSDIKNNEIMLFTTLKYDEDIIPTRNIYLTLPNGTTEIPRHTVFIEKGEEYITLFDLNIDSANELSRYTYIVNHMNINPQLIKTNDSGYIFELINSTVMTGDSDVFFECQYQSSGNFPELTTCKFVIEKNMIMYDMDIDIPNQKFIIHFDPYTIIPEGEQTFYFILTHPDHGEFSEYQIKLMLRKNLDDTMLSNTFVDEITGEINISDIPMVLKSYYDNIQSYDEFEYFVLQRLLTTLDIDDKRMMTDFTNIKFPNAFGPMENMLHNLPTLIAVEDMYLNTLPASPIDKERYIIGGNELPEFEGKSHYIAQYEILTNSWSTYEPQMDDIVYVTSKDCKYIYCTKGWVKPIFNVPLKLDIDVEKSSDSSKDVIEIIDSIKKKIIESFSGRFGNKTTLARSEIISVVQNIDGVDHCKVIEPFFNIFYNFELTDLTEDELLKYSPEYMYFTEDNIDITVI